MLIKPLIRKEDIKHQVSIKSLPSGEIDPQTNHPAYFGTLEEKTESIENEGRLLMLTIMYKEWNIKMDKQIHDTNGTCWRTWPICDCQFAKNIRRRDLYLEVI